MRDSSIATLFFCHMKETVALAILRTNPLRTRFGVDQKLPVCFSLSIKLLVRAYQAEETAAKRLKGEATTSLGYQ